MIYLREKSFKRQVDLLDFFCNQGEFDLIIWFFPEPVLSNICDLELAPKDIIQGEQVTFYGDAINPMKTVRVRLTKDLISKIRATVSGRVASAASPYNPRVGNMTTPPF